MKHAAVSKLLGHVLQCNLVAEANMSSNAWPLNGETLISSLALFRLLQVFKFKVIYIKI